MTTGKPVRMWRWRSNPLRRRSDRVEAWVVLCAILAVLFGGGVTAAFTWTATLDLAEEQRAERRRVPAVVTGDAGSGGSDTMWRASDSSSARASVRWTTPDGAERTGVAEVSVSTRAGDTVHVWTDADGRQSVAPAGARMSLFHAGIGAALTSGTLAAIVCLVQAGVRARIDRRRSEAWERAWAEVEPRWRHHAS